MKPKNLLVLAVVVAVLGSFIVFFERHQPTTDEVGAVADRLLPDLERESVTAVVVERPEGTLRVVREDGAWRLEEPLSWPADTLTVDGVLDAILGLESRRALAADGTAVADYGLDDPPMAVTLEIEGGDPVRVSVGERTALGSDRAVSLGDGRVVLTPGWFVEQLEKPTNEWRSRAVLDTSLGQLAALTVVDREGDRVEAVSLDGDWRLLSPVEDLADTEHLRRVVGDLAGARIAEFADDPTPDQLALVDEPAYRLSVNPNDGSPAVSLDFSAIRDGRRLCRRDGEALFWIEEQPTTVLTKAPILWREPDVRPFSTWDVEAVDITTVGDGTVALRREDGLWTVNGADADADVVRNYLQDLAEQEASAFDLADFGEPVQGTVQVILRGFDDETSEELHYTFFAAATAGGPSSVTVSGRPGRMAVPAGAAADVLAGADFFRAAPESPEEEAGAEAEAP
jgi:hypothetical protein